MQLEKGLFSWRLSSLNQMLTFQSLHWQSLSSPWISKLNLSTDHTFPQTSPSFLKFNAHPCSRTVCIFHQHVSSDRMSTKQVSKQHGLSSRWNILQNKTISAVTDLLYQHNCVVMGTFLACKNFFSLLQWLALTWCSFSCSLRWRCCQLDGVFL